MDEAEERRIWKRDAAELRRSEVYPALLNVRQNTYSQYEIGVLNYPIDVLIRLACYYNTSVDYLLGLTDERTPYPRVKNRDF